MSKIFPFPTNGKALGTKKHGAPLRRRGKKAREAKGGFELGAGAELYGMHSQAAAGQDVGPDIVNVQDAIRLRFGGAYGGAEDRAARFAGANGARVDPRGEVTHEAESRLQMFDMEGIGVGEQDETVAPGQASEQAIRKQEIGFGNDDAIPCGAELLEGDARVEACGEVFIPILGSDAALLPGSPERVLLNRSPHFFRRQVCGAANGGGADGGEGAERFESDDYTAEVEDDGFDSGLGGFGTGSGHGSAIEGNSEIRGGQSEIGVRCAWTDWGDGFAAASAEGTDDAGKQRKENDGEDDVMNAAAEVWHQFADGVPAEDHAADPEDATSDVIGKVLVIAHLCGAGDGRAKRADDWDEAGKDNGFAAIGSVELVRAVKVLALEK